MSFLNMLAGLKDEQSLAVLYPTSWKGRLNNLQNCTASGIGKLHSLMSIKHGDSNTCSPSQLFCQENENNITGQSVHRSHMFVTNMDC
jgi:hypothetical protein